jgi:predicted dehydrogenase
MLLKRLELPRNANHSSVRAFRKPGVSGRLAVLALLTLFVAAAAAPAQVPGRGAKKRAGAPSKTAGSDVQPKAVFAKFPDWVGCVAFSPDNKTLAAGSYGVLKLYDVVEERELAALPEPAGFVKAVAFSADGKTIVTGAYQSLLVWDLGARQVVRRLKGHRGYVTSVAFSPNEKTLASASDDETVRLWDIVSGEPRGTLPGIEQPALAVAYSRDGHLLAVATGDATRPTKKGSARVYEASGHPLFELEGHNRLVTAVAFAPDGGTLATASADESIKLWDSRSGKEQRELEGHSRPVNSLAFLPDGKWLVSVCGGRAEGGNELKLWDLSSGKDVATVPAHEGPIHQLALSGDGKYLATASLDKSAKVFEVAAILGAAGHGPAKPTGRDDDFLPDSPPLPEPRDPASAANAVLALAGEDQAEKPEPVKQFRVGIIGLDTSHSVAFTQILNDANPKEDVAGCRVVAAYPRGSADIKSSTERVPEYTTKVVDLGVEIVNSIEELVQKVDAVLLESNDGRPHLEQVLPVLKAARPVFIDKPIAGSLADAVAIFEAARQSKVPVFSSSSLRYVSSAQAIRNGKIGEVKGCDAYSPCSLEATHPDFFWYGIHGVETLFTVMGTGCESVTRVSTPGIDLAAGVWKGGRVGTFRGIRTPEGGGKADYGGTAFGTSGIQTIGTYEGYRPLVVEIVRFFRTGKSPVAEQETLEIYAFMEAADESKRQGGKPVTLESVLARARAEAAKKSLK